VAVWPRAGANPVDREGRAAYYDSMFHSVAVVGVNTSALIEAGIVGRVVFSVVDAAFAATQEGTLHFQHLKRVNGGLLHLASSLDEHCAQLAGMLADVSGRAQAPRAFVEAFVRPYGLDVPATPRVVDALEALATSAHLSAPPPRSGALWRPVLAPVAAAILLASADADRRRAILRGWTRGHGSRKKAAARR
jgi:hypothetical protein